MKKTAFILVVAGLVITFLAGCTKPYPFAPIQALEQVKFTTGDTTYLEINPPFGGVDGPTALLIGNDNLMYVANGGDNKILMMNIAGALLGERDLLQPTALAQDQRLDLLLGGTVAKSTGDTVGAVFRIHLVQVSHQLAEAKMDTVWREDAHPHRRVVGIAVMPDNH
jgi:hypothetical protein